MKRKRERHREKERERGREGQRQRERPIDRQTCRHTNKDNVSERKRHRLSTF